MTTPALPTFFISHGGGPWPWMEDQMGGRYDKLKAALQQMPRLVQRTGIAPKAVLMISAHWEEPEFTVMANPKPPMIYDYYGFPDYTYQIQYAAPGAPQLAARQRRLEQVPRAHRALGCARADDRVQLVNKQNHLPIRALYFAQDRF